MFSSEQLISLIQDALSRHDDDKASGGKTNEARPGDKGISLTPQKALVIAGLLGGILEVDSVLVDRNQNVEIVLVGTLRHKTQFEKLLAQIGSLPFDEVMKGFIGRMV